MTDAFTTITSPADPRVKNFHLRHEGVFGEARAMIVDSERVVRRFLRRGLVLENLLGTAEGVARLHAEFPELSPANTLQAERAVLEAIIGFRFHQGVIAQFQRPSDQPLHALGPRVMVFDGVSDAENVGAVARSAHALGFTGLLVGETSCSPWLRRAIRVSMGSIAALAVHHSRDVAADLATLKSLGFCIVGLAAAPESPALHALQASLPDVALVLGSENDGLRAATMAQCSTLTHVPMAQGCDSLNAAIAASIACYHFRLV